MGKTMGKEDKEMRRNRAGRLVLLVLLCAAAALLSGPRSAARAGEIGEVSASPDLSLAQTLRPGSLAEVGLSAGGTVFSFSLASNGLYGVYLFPGEEAAPEAHVELWQGDVLLLESDALMPAMTVRLTAGAAYALRLTGSGRVRLEVTRQALNRCFAQPLALETRGGDYAKSIARPDDAHWYSVKAESEAPLLLLGVPVREGLRLKCQLFDGEGRLLAEGIRTAGGACLLDIAPEAGRRYALRVSALNGASGLYSLRMIRADGGVLPDRVTLDSASILLKGRQTRVLTARVRPDGASDMLFWESSDPGVAAVDGAGVVTGRSPGTAVVTAYGMGGVYARCAVQVEHVAVTGVAFEDARLLMRVGDEAAPAWTILPAAAVDRAATLSSTDEAVVLAEGGTLTAVGEGEAAVVVRTRDGGYTASLPVLVLPAERHYRALLIGQQNYAATVASPRPGTANTLGNLRGMLGTLSYCGEGFRVSTLMDEGRDGILAALRQTFDGARDRDFSLIYITCHGDYTDGMTCFRLVDGSLLTAVELEQELRRIPGELLILIDCCGSGGAVGRGSATKDILAGIGAVFGGQMGEAPLASSRYRVLASAALEQDSYRIGFKREGAALEMDTVFARALCEAGGWDVDRGAWSAMRADLNYDNEVTMAELYGYLTRRALWLLSRADALNGESGVQPQTIQLWPRTDGGVVFARTNGE